LSQETLADHIEQSGAPLAQKAAAAKKPAKKAQAGKKKYPTI